MQNKVILCQSEQQINRLIREHDLKQSGSVIISCNPETTWALQKHAIHFVSIEEFQINKPSDQIELLQSNHIKWADNIDRFLQENISDFESAHFNPAHNYLFYLKSSWDTFIHRADLLEQIIKEEIPDEILFFGNQYPIQYDSSLKISGSVLSECIPPLAQHHGIKWTALPAVSGDTFWEEEVQMNTGLRRKITSKFPPVMVHHIESIINNPKLSDLSLWVRSSEKTGTIIVRNSYDLTKDINHHLWKYGMSTRSFDLAVSQSQTYAASSPSIDRALTEAWQRAVDLDWFWQPRGWQKWSLRTCLEPMFHNFWFRCIPELWKSFTGSRIYLQKEHPYGICVPLISGPKETGFIMAAHNEKIPVIFYQHGASMGDIENACWDIEDSNYSDFQLVYGVRAAKYIRSRHNFSGSRAVPIPVGSARLDLVSHGISEKKVSALRRSILGKNDVPLIVYVPGIFLNNTFRYTYLDCRDCRTFNLRSRVAEIFNNHPEMHFSYKAFVSSGHDPTLEMMKKICPKCSIIDNILLTELQWAADFIIYEVPSTGMYEGLITNKPMIVHVDRDIYRMPNEVKDLLWKRVCITETSLDLIEKVNQFLEHPDFTPVTNPDREFIKAFCTHFDDGQSTQRAADAITIIVKNKGDQVLQSDIVC